MHGKPNEQLFPRQVVIQQPKYVTHKTGEPKYKYGQQEQVTVRNHNRSTALEQSVLKYWGIKILGVGLNRFYGIPTRPQLLLWLKTYCYLFGLREGFLTHQWIITGNK